jgi:hypothetical protein
MQDNRVKDILEAKEQYLTHRQDMVKQLIPFRYRVALHIANYLYLYIPLVFLVGVLIGYIAG